MQADSAQLGQIAQLVETGVIRPVIDSVFAFDAVSAAMACVASGRARGKVVIEVTPAAPPPSVEA